MISYTSTLSPHIELLHSRYQTLTGLTVALTMAREGEWQQWLRYGKTCGQAWDVDDLAMVVAFIRRRIKERRRNSGSLKFHNLIGKADYFEEDLSEARAEARAPQSSTRTRVLALTGRVEHKEAPALTAAQVMQRKGFAEQLKAMKEAM